MVWEVLREPHPSKSAHSAAVCLVVRAEARNGAEERVGKLLREFAYQVRNDELGCDSYVVTRLMGADGHFAAHARFVDFTAFRAHGETEHLESLLDRLTPLLASPFSMEIYFEL
ncbi:putative quinol monooxygenase [Vitreimonas sp.]|uniref:putative quinol monooxygenase n=1 Tax=Vitreimonas sp. TaxID=3069702 RepID=UPI002ED94AF5